ELKKLNEAQASLSAKFSNQLLGAAKNAALVITDVSQLQGLTEAEKNRFAANAKERGMEGKWLLPLKNTTQQPALPSLENRDTRKALFEASWTRAERGDSNDTRSTITKIATVRARKAQLLGFKNYASWKLQDQM